MIKKEIEDAIELPESPIKKKKAEILVAVQGFKDKNIDRIYPEGTKFVVDKKVEEITEVIDGTCKISEERAKELKASGLAK